MTKRKLLIILLILAIALPTGITFSKYAYQFIYNFILEANNFFFNSNKLTANGKTYNINNWGGIAGFTIQFDLDNYKNNILTSDSDIEYEIELTCPDPNINCTINSSSGILRVADKKAYFTITVQVLNGTVFETGEQIEINVKAKSLSPYEKELKAKFIATVGKKGLSYEIDDVPNQAYLNYVITNALDQYKCINSYGSVTAGAIISTEEYKSLSTANKANYASAIITLTFDPSRVILDTTNNLLNNATNIVNTNVDGVPYISSLTFKVEASSSNSIRFYKIDKTQDYSYTFGSTNTPEISISYQA